LARRALDLDEVFLLDPVRRMGELLGELSVVGEDDEAFAVRVEPSHGEDPWCSRHERGHRGPALWIAGSCNDPAGLVEEVVDMPWQPTDPGAIDRHRLVGRVDAPAQCRPLPVHRHPPRCYQLFAGTAAPEPGAGQQFLKTLFARLG
jgi:hypothetical protein